MTLAVSIVCGVHFLVATGTQPENQNYTLIFRAEVQLLDEASRESVISFELEISITTGHALPVRVNFPWTVRGSSELNTSKIVTIGAGTPSVSLSKLCSNSCLVLKDIILVKSAGPGGWEVFFDGSSYTYVPSIPWLMSAGSTQGSEAEALSSWVSVVEVENGTIWVDLKILASSARKHELDLWPLEDTDPRITFSAPEGTHVGRSVSGRPLLLAESQASNLTLPGYFTQETWNLDFPRSHLVPFTVSLDLTEVGVHEVGRQVVLSLIDSAKKMMDAEEGLLDFARTSAPDFLAKLQQARLDLEDLEEQISGAWDGANIFPLERAIKLACQAEDEMVSLIAASSLVVAPLTFPVVLILGLTTSHLLFNGSKKATVALFVAFSVLALEIHPGLRLFLLSVRPEVWLESLKYVVSEEGIRSISSGFPFSLPPQAIPILSVTLTILRLLITCVLVFVLVYRYRGTASVYGLAASSAVRSIKKRKLRGALSIISVAVIAMAVVPSLTLKLVVPVVSDMWTRDQLGGDMVSFSNSWSLFRASSSMGMSYSETSKGVVPLTLDEAESIAERIGMAEYTPICLAVCRVGENEGSIIIADITYLKDHLGFKWDQFDSSSDRNAGVLMNSWAFQNQSIPSSLTVGGLALPVIGTFDPSTLKTLDGAGLQDYLEETRILEGAADWETLAGPTYRLSPIGAIKRVMYTGVSWGEASGRKYYIPTPIIAVVDISAIRSFLSPMVLFVTGTLDPGANLDEIEQYLRSLIYSNKIRLAGSRGALVIISMDFVSSYSAMIAGSSQVKTIRVGFPVPMAFGTWYAQLVLMSIGSLIILTILLNSTYERRKEAFIMSSLGASPTFISYTFIAEGLVLGIMGGCMGYILGYVWTYWIGVGSPEVGTELHSLTPLILVLFTSLVVTAVGSSLPAKSAILRVVPSKVMLRREVGDVRVESDGARIVSIPLRLRQNQIEKLSAFISNMVRYYSLLGYGIRIRSHEGEAGGERLLIDYRKISGLSERSASYLVKVRYVPAGGFFGVELTVRSPDGKWDRDQLALVKQVLYDLQDELLKVTLSRQWEVV